MKHNNLTKTIGFSIFVFLFAALAKISQNYIEHTQFNAIIIGVASSITICGIVLMNINQSQLIFSFMIVVSCLSLIYESFSDEVINEIIYGTSFFSGIIFIAIFFFVLNKVKGNKTCSKSEK